MGIRIHKMMGYGLGDIKTKNGKIIDERFNPFPEDGWGIAEDTVKEFLGWLKKERMQARKLCAWADNNRIPENNYDSDIGQIINYFENGGENSPFIYYDAEYGNSKVMMFCPIECPDWCRYDNTIDYYEFGSEPKNKINWFKNSCGIYPWLGMVKKQGSADFSGDVYEPLYKSPPFFNPAEFNMMIGVFSKKSKPTTTLEHVDYLIKNYRCCIPDSILLYTKFLGIFKNWEQTIQELKPGIYTYWS